MFFVVCKFNHPRTSILNIHTHNGTKFLLGYVYDTHTHNIQEMHQRGCMGRMSRPKTDTALFVYRVFAHMLIIWTEPKILMGRALCVVMVMVR